MKCRYFLPTLLACLLFAHLNFGQDDEKEIFSSLRLTHRVNAHGDEFMSMDMSPDRSRLAIGTEKGDVYVWNIAAGKIEHQFHEGRPVHQVVFVDDSHLVIAGGDHTGVHNCLFGRLDISNGKFEEWSGAGGESLIYLSFDRGTDTIVTANPLGPITAWNVTKATKLASWKADKPIASLVVAGGSLFVARIDQSIQQVASDDSGELSGDIAVYPVSDQRAQPKIFLASKNGLAGKLTVSPDGSVLAANLVQGEQEKLAFYDTKTAALMGTVDQPQLNLRWLSDKRAIVSDTEEPVEFVSIDKAKGVVSQEIAKGGGFHGSGSPSGVSGQEASVDEKKAWLVYEKIGSLIEFDLANKTAKTLIYLPPFPYAMDVREFGTSGYIATGGDDKFIRVWDLNDLHLAREIPSDRTPQGIALLSDGKTVVYSCSSDNTPTDIVAVDIPSGASKKLMSLPSPFARIRKGGDGFLYEVGSVQRLAANDKDKETKVAVTKLVQAASDGKTGREYGGAGNIDAWATSHNGRWLVISDNDHKLTVFDLVSGEKQKPVGDMGYAPSYLAVTNDGRAVFAVGFTEPLKRWDVTTGQVKTIAEYRPVASSLNLSADEKFAIVGGSHFDLGVYEIATGKTGFYTRVDASDFYVPQAWMKGDRLIYVTDGGVMFDGILAK